MPTHTPTHRQKLKIAFSVHVAQMIVEADGVLDYSEMRLLGRMFPTELLQACGFVDADGAFTSAYDDARHEALGELPGALSLHEKLDLVTVFHRASMADGALDPQEVTLLQESADLLGVTRAQLTEHLDRMALGPDSPVPPVRD